MLRALMISLLFSVTVCVDAGELRTDEIHSKALERTVKVNVLLPDDYGADDERRFPAVYLLHGLGGDYREWQRVGVEEEARGLPVIIVMPEGDQSFYANFHDDPRNRWEDYITQEVIGHVDAAYRTVARREKRAVSGLSMGGYGAVMLGLRHPELFASVASHSGALGIVSSPRQRGGIADRVRKIFGPDDSPSRKAYDIRLLIRDLPREDRPHIYLDCGHKDFLLGSNRDFVKTLADLDVHYEYREVPGRHDFAYWKANVRYSLTRQLEALEKAVARPRPEKPAAVAGATDGGVVGAWSLVVDFDGNSFDYTLEITQEGDKLTGVLISPRSGKHEFRSVRFKEGALRLEIDRDIQGTPVTFVYEGKLSAKGLEGKVIPEGFEDQFNGTWKAERKKAAKASNL